MGLCILFCWSGTPVYSQLVFCVNFCVWWCIPDVSMERDRLHVHLLLHHLVLYDFFFFFKFSGFPCMAIHSSTLARKIPWMEEPGGLQSMESQRVGHDWTTSLSLSCGSDGIKTKKKSACNAGYLGLIPGLERSPGVENGYPLQYSCLRNPMERGAW